MKEGSWLFGRLKNAGARLLSPGSFFSGNRKETVTEEEIISMVDEAHERGVIQEDEAEMIQNIMSFDEKEAHDIMTHRKNVIAFEQHIMLQEMADRILEEGISRYPIYDGSLDNIVGIVHYKDVLKFLTRNPWAKHKEVAELPGLIREVFLIPETRSILDLFRLMQRQKTHMAVVVDEYGQTAGIVCMEDILEEIVGDILDEYDEDEFRFKAQGEGSVVIDALTRLDEVEDRLGVSFGDGPYETLNGFLTDCLGHVPAREDLDRTVEAVGYRFRILSLGKHTIGKVRAEKIRKTDGSDNEESQSRKPFSAAGNRS